MCFFFFSICTSDIKSCHYLLCQHHPKALILQFMCTGEMKLDEWNGTVCMENIIWFTAKSQIQLSGFFSFFSCWLVQSVETKGSPIPMFLTWYLQFFSSSSGKLAVRCGRVLAQVSFGFTSTRWVQKWVTDTSSKGSECLYESRFVQNVHDFFSPKWCLLRTMIC